jgi:hypothetical protein
MLPMTTTAEANGYRATVVLQGLTYSAEGTTEDAAKAAVQAHVEDLVQRGVIKWWYPKPFATQEQEDQYAELMRNIVRDVYRERDAQKAAEYPA